MPLAAVAARVLLSAHRLSKTLARCSLPLPARTFRTFTQVDPGGAGGARTHDRPIMRTTARRSRRSTCAVACPYHRPVIQFIRVVAHRVIRVVAHVAAHRAAGMRMYDGAALAIVQAEDRQRDPVQVGKHGGRGGAAVCSAILLVSLVVSFRTVLACGVAWRPVSAGRPRRACARIVRAIEGTEDRTA
jgi:hypothetical protein